MLNNLSFENFFGNSLEESIMRGVAVHNSLVCLADCSQIGTWPPREGHLVRVVVA
jgi:hypothetical protein